MDLKSSYHSYNFYDKEISSEFQRLNEYRKQKKFTNLILLTSDGTKYHVHEIVVSTICPYFKRLFSSCFKEYKPTEIQLDRHISSSNFEAILTYIYTGQIEITVENAILLNEHAYNFGLMKLKEASEKALAKNINLENILTMWRCAETFSNNELKKMCRHFILQNSRKFFDQHLVSLKYNEVSTTFSNQDIGHDLSYTYLTKWIKEDFKNREKYIVDLLKRVDFGSLSNDFKTNQIKTDTILMSSTIFNKFLIDVLLNMKASHSDSQQQNSKAVIKEENIKINSDDPRDDLIFLITPSYISALNLKKPVPRFVPITKFDFNKTFQPIYDNSDNILFCGLKKGRSCKSFSYRTNTFNDLSPMLERRERFGITELGEKIFVCGGQSNKGSVEFYDIHTEKWMWGKSMPKQHLYDFKVLNYNQSIYTFGGSFEYGIVNGKGETCKKIVSSDLVQRYDHRENVWQIVSVENSIYNVVEAFAVKDNTIRLFTHISESCKLEIHDYDIRNKKMWKLPNELPPFRQCSFYKSKDDIYLLGTLKGSFFQNKIGRLDKRGDIVKFTELYNLYLSSYHFGSVKLLNVGLDQHNYLFS